MVLSSVNDTGGLVFVFVFVLKEHVYFLHNYFGHILCTRQRVLDNSFRLILWTIC